MTIIRDLWVKKTDKYYKVFDRVIIDQHPDRAILVFFKKGILVGIQDAYDVNLSRGDVLNLKGKRGELLFTIRGGNAEG